MEIREYQIASLVDHQLLLENRDGLWQLPCVCTAERGNEVANLEKALMRRFSGCEIYIGQKNSFLKSSCRCDVWEGIVDSPPQEQDSLRYFTLIEIEQLEVSSVVLHVLEDLQRRGILSVNPEKYPWKNGE